MLEGDLRQRHAVRVCEGPERSDDASNTVLLRAREDGIEVIRAFDPLDVRQRDPDLSSSRLELAVDFGERAPRSGAENTKPQC